MKKTKLMGRLIIAVALLPTLAKAQELVSGWEGGPSYGYAFVSPLFSVPKSAQNTFMIRPTVSYLYYNFQQDGSLTAVNSPGAALQIGYRRQTRRGTYTIGPGVEVRWEHRTLANGQQFTGTQTGATVQGEAFFQANSLTNLNIISSYGTANHYMWTRAGFKRQVTNTKLEGRPGLAIGAELNGQGNHDVHQLEAGGLIEIPLLPHNTSLQLRGGYAHLWFADGSTHSRPYVGVGFYHHF